jgi:branched-chain amino acid transport system permease protein
MIQQCALLIWDFKMLKFLTTLLISLSTGAIYSLISIAIVLVWRSTRVINFAQVGQATASTYIGFEITTRTDNFWLGLLGAIFFGAALGAAIDRYFMRPLFKNIKTGPILMTAPVVATLGLLGLIESIIGFIWGLENKIFDAPVSTVGFTIGDTVIAFSPFNLLILISVAIMMIFFAILFQKTNVGLALRASAYSPEIASLSGIRVNSIRTLGWALAGGAGALAGMLFVPSASLYPTSMSVLLVFGFVSAVIGGLDSLFGAVAGAMILGFAINFAATYISSSLVFPMTFVMLILVLLFRPNGVFSIRKNRVDK